MKIAVDAMGGDHAPAEVVRGAVHASREFHLPIVLVGREERIREELRRAGAGADELEVENATEAVEMQDAPGVALRKKKDSSIRVGLNLVADGKASSFVSAGNSGAVMAGALMILRKIRGGDRPATAATTPTPTPREAFSPSSSSAPAPAMRNSSRIRSSGPTRTMGRRNSRDAWTAPRTTSAGA